MKTQCNKQTLILLFICAILYACGDTEDRIKLMQKDFEFEMPRCYSEMYDKSFFDINDYTLNLVFRLDNNCIEQVEENLLKAKKYQKSSDSIISFYFKQIKPNEYAKLELNKTEKILKYQFIHE